jgi:polysaccharide biosynthesis transport protein
MADLLTDDRRAIERARPARVARPVPSSLDVAPSAASLLQVIWYRRRTLAVTVFVCLALAAAHLVISTPIFSSTAQVYVGQNGPKAYSENAGNAAPSETYLNSEAGVVQSAPVLSRALAAVNYQNLKTFAGVQGDPVNWLQRGSSLKVEPGRKSDLIAVTMESAHPREAAAFVNAVVDAYVAERTQERRASGSEIVRALQKERNDLEKKRQACLTAMVQLKQENGVLSFRDEKGNIILDRTAALSTALTTAQTKAWELREQQMALKTALADPTAIAAFVESQQFKTKEIGDREYDELRSQLLQYMLALSNTSSLQGENNVRVQALQASIDRLRSRITQKEREIAEACLSDLAVELSASEENVRQLQSALAEQRKTALALGPQAAQYAGLETDLERIQKQAEVLSNRIAEVNVNTDAGPLDVRVVERPRVADEPIKPRKSLVLAAAVLAGSVLGLGLALVREWHGAPLRSADEAVRLAGAPIVTLVPRINPKLSPVLRGQIVHLDPRSPAAEAYRSARTVLSVGALRDAKTVLIASPAAGDGKSTTAANLAISFAQAGNRTLLIDCDLREPVQHLIFDVDPDGGLSGVVGSESKLRDAIKPTRVPGLYLLPCGPVPPNPSELLASKRFDLLMQTLAGAFDRIIIDSPPITSVADTRILASAAEATVLVVRINQSMRRSAALAVEALEKAEANLAGVIANDVATPRQYRYYGGSWQYAVGLKRLSGTNGADGSNGADDDSWPGNGRGRTVPDEVLAIDDPDWSAGKA